MAKRKQWKKTRRQAFMDKHGPEAGDRLYRALQRHAALARWHRHDGMVQKENRGSRLR